MYRGLQSPLRLRSISQIRWKRSSPVPRSTMATVRISGSKPSLASALIFHIVQHPNRLFSPIVLLHEPIFNVPMALFPLTPAHDPTSFPLRQSIFLQNDMLRLRRSLLSTRSILLLAPVRVVLAFSR